MTSGMTGENIFKWVQCNTLWVKMMMIIYAFIHVFIGCFETRVDVLPAVCLAVRLWACRCWDPSGNIRQQDLWMRTHTRTLHSGPQGKQEAIDKDNCVMLNKQRRQARVRPPFPVFFLSLSLPPFVSRRWLAAPCCLSTTAQDVPRCGWSISGKPRRFPRGRSSPTGCRGRRATEKTATCLDWTVWWTSFQPWWRRSLESWNREQKDDRFQPLFFFLLKHF